jgi:hypothetical protein
MIGPHSLASCLPTPCTTQGLVYYCQGPMASLALLAGTAAEAASRQLTSAGNGSSTSAIVAMWYGCHLWSCRSSSPPHASLHDLLSPCPRVVEPAARQGICPGWGSCGEGNHAPPTPSCSCTLLQVCGLGQCTCMWVCNWGAGLRSLQSVPTHCIILAHSPNGS